MAIIVALNTAGQARLKVSKRVGSIYIVGRIGRKTFLLLTLFNWPEAVKDPLGNPALTFLIESVSQISMQLPTSLSYPSRTPSRKKEPILPYQMYSDWLRPLFGCCGNFLSENQSVTNTWVGLLGTYFLEKYVCVCLCVSGLCSWFVIGHTYKYSCIRMSNILENVYCIH